MSTTGEQRCGGAIYARLRILDRDGQRHVVTGPGMAVVWADDAQIFQVARVVRVSLLLAALHLEKEPR